MQLAELGWDSAWEAHFRALGAPANWIPGRISRLDRLPTVETAKGTFLGKLSGRFQHQCRTPLDQPAVGDWVALEVVPGSSRARLHAVLPRRTQFVRKAAGKSSLPQVVAANIERVFLITGLDEDFNLRRIERYLAVAAQSGAEPVIILNKVDLCARPEIRDEVMAAVEGIAGGCPVLALSATGGDGMEALTHFLQPGETAALLGSSGVGKSTLLNVLAGEAWQTIQANRAADGRGRHTTTARELFRLPGGALLIDTPGMRELGLSDGESDLTAVFAAFEELARDCRFSDCEHVSEPGCALRAALADGRIEAAPFAHWQKLRSERALAANRHQIRQRQAEKNRWKRLSEQAKARDAGGGSDPGTPRPRRG